MFIMLPKGPIYVYLLFICFVFFVHFFLFLKAMLVFHNTVSRKCIQLPCQSNSISYITPKLYIVTPATRYRNFSTAIQRNNQGLLVWPITEEKYSTGGGEREGRGGCGAGRQRKIWRVGLCSWAVNQMGPDQ